MQHLIKACATSMVPARLIKFSADTAAVTYDPPRRCLVTGLLTARIDGRIHRSQLPVASCEGYWADVWGGAIASSFHREKWTPALLQQLSQTCPHAQTKGVEVLVVMLCKAALLDLEQLSKFVRCASTSPTVAASLICDYTHSDAISSSSTTSLMRPRTTRPKSRLSTKISTILTGLKVLRASSIWQRILSKS